MIVLKENGRLGNQLFQYCALRTLAADDETICLLGFSDLESVFTGLEAEIVNQHSKKHKRSFYYRLYKYAETLSGKNIIPVVWENADYKLVETEAPLKKLKIARNMYAQSEENFSVYTANKLKIRQHWVKQSKKLLSEVTEEGHVPIFVHVRRGDYSVWPDPRYPAILSTEYYREAVYYIRRIVKFPFFIFVSDEPAYVRDEFKDIQPRYVSEHDSQVDFAIMSECKGGVLSASSFSWWAAYFIYCQDEMVQLIAPKYWAGHRKGEWYPKKIRSSFLMYINGS